jgi:hypothetical protein
MTRVLRDIGENNGHAFIVWRRNNASISFRAYVCAAIDRQLKRDSSASIKSGKPGFGRPRSIRRAAAFESRAAVIDHRPGMALSSAWLPFCAWGEGRSLAVSTCPGRSASEIFAAASILMLPIITDATGKPFHPVLHVEHDLITEPATRLIILFLSLFFLYAWSNECRNSPRTPA